MSPFQAHPPLAGSAQAPVTREDQPCTEKLNPSPPPGGLLPVAEASPLEPVSIHLEHETTVPPHVLEEGTPIGGTGAHWPRLQVLLECISLWFNTEFRLGGQQQLSGARQQAVWVSHEVRVQDHVTRSPSLRTVGVSPRQAPRGLGQQPLSICLWNKAVPRQGTQTRGAVRFREPRPREAKAPGERRFSKPQARSCPLFTQSWRHKTTHRLCRDSGRDPGAVVCPHVWRFSLAVESVMAGSWYKDLGCFHQPVPK